MLRPRRAANLIQIRDNITQDPLVKAIVDKSPSRNELLYA